MSATPKILIVGAGPVGLTLALLLRQYNINVKLIDQLEKRSRFSHALTVNSASLKIFQGLGVADKLLKMGKKCHRVEVLFNGKKTAFLKMESLKSQFNFYLSLPQPILEDILVAELKNFDLIPEYKHRYISLEQKTKSVAVTISNDAVNRTDTLEFDYVIGCDGAHSLIRKSLNIPFTGVNYPIHLLLADLKFKKDHAITCGKYYVRPNGFLALFPMESGYTRIAVQEKGVLPDNILPLEINEIQSYLNEYLSEKFEVTACIWSSRARVTSRIAEKCHINRVFLAGDAWHLFSPVGGQAMNTGFQDAFDLGWKLAYFLHEKMSYKILDSYETDRMFAINKVLTNTDYFTNLISGQTQKRAVMENFKPLFKNRVFFKETLPILFSGYAADYRERDTDIVGQHVPYVEFSNVENEIQSTYDLPRLGKFILIAMQDTTNLACLAQKSYANILKIIKIPTYDTIMIKTLLLNETNMCLISPAGYIAAHGSFEQIEKYFVQYKKG